jgi:large subunit ribosomal protein L13
MGQQAVSPQGSSKRHWSKAPDVVRRQEGPFAHIRFDGPTPARVTWGVGLRAGPTHPRMKTYSPKPEHIERRWYVIDAGDAVLGRLASEAAALLRGKHKPIFAPHMDTGDHVIIVNADKVVLTGGKEFKKVAYRHSGYPGGITATQYDRLMTERPVFVIEKAIRGMLPKNRLGRAMIRKLHVVAGAEHPHAPQKPEPYTLGKPPMWAGLPEPSVKQRRAVADKPASKTETAAEESTGPARKSSAKSPAKKATTRKTTAKKTTARKSTAKSTAGSTAKKTTAKSTAKKTTARKPPAAKATPDTNDETSEE